MKRLNKILALVLAMTMMFGVVSVCASAVDTVNASYKIAFKDSNLEDPKLITSAKAGDIVDIYISIKTNSYSPLFAFLAFYDYTAMTQIRQGGNKVQNISDANCSQLLGRFANELDVENPSQDLIDHEDDEIGVGKILDWGASVPTTTPHTDDMYPASFTDAQKAQYKGVNFGYLAPTNKTVLTVNTEGNYEEMVRLRFLVNKDITLDNSVFYFLDDAASTYIAVDPDDEPFSRLQASAPVKVSNLTVEYEGGTPATDVKVNNVDAQVRWANKGANLIDLGFRGQIAEGYDASADKTGEKGVNGGDQLAKLTEVGFYIDNSKVPAYTIYNFVDGGYFYRAVVANVDYQNTDSISAKAYVVIDGKEYTAAEAFTTSAKAEYDEVKSSMEA